jgi:hypothetical protein
MTQNEVDQLVDQWHTDPNIAMPLHEHLGWTPDQYATYVETGKIPDECTN